MQTKSVSTVPKVPILPDVPVVERLRFNAENER
jgi:type II secretory pathway component HofQ